MSLQEKAPELAILLASSAQHLQPIFEVSRVVAPLAFVEMAGAPEEHPALIMPRPLATPVIWRRRNIGDAWGGQPALGLWQGADQLGVAGRFVLASILCRASARALAQVWMGIHDPVADTWAFTPLGVPILRGTILLLLCPPMLPK
jgi:hypothetical protein